ncbi:MAG TPA: hypothetical protein VHD59_07515 [Pseudolabrys sp.]|jgi:hypothetical protein|nr:hypothetical protein [Pseudolabrys sp.]
MADCLVRLGLAFTVIVVVTAGLYAANAPRALAIEPAAISTAK